MPRSDLTLASLLLSAAALSSSACSKHHEATPLVVPQSRQAPAQESPGETAPDAPSGMPPRAAGASEADGDAAPRGPRPRIPTTPGLKVAFFGDGGIRPGARAVLELVQREHADAVVHLGDFTYDDGTPEQWDAQINATLGRDFPYFAAVGNHDVASWNTPNGFAQLLRARLARIPDARCEGEYGVDAGCTFRGLFFVLSGVGTWGSDHELQLTQLLAGSDALHKICTWHKNQHDMQAGGKTDEVGWLAYRVCQGFGAPIITGHEHSYARTYNLRSVGVRDQGHGAFGPADSMSVGPGRTFVAVSGLGGYSARVRTPDHASDSWWATIYAADYQLVNGVLRGSSHEIEFGALFVTFGAEDDPTLARAYFKTVSGKIYDQFSWNAEK